MTRRTIKPTSISRTTRATPAPTSYTQRAALTQFYATHRRMPTYSELATLWHYKSKGAVRYAVEKLLREGFLAKDTNGTLVPHSRMHDVKLLGYVEAGFPSAAEEELVDTMSLDEYLIENKEATFMLKVKGDSMIDAGIMEGDIVLVERGKAPKPGEIVIAQIDGEYTMKYFRKKGSAVYLEAANTNYKPFYPKEALRVEAIVRAVIRKY